MSKQKSILTNQIEPPNASVMCFRRSVLLRRQDADDWLNFRLSEKNLKPTFTTQGTLTEKVSEQVFSKERRRLQVQHLWMEVKLWWLVFSCSFLIVWSSVHHLPPLEIPGPVHTGPLLVSPLFTFSSPSYSFNYPTLLSNQTVRVCPFRAASKRFFIPNYYTASGVCPYRTASGFHSLLVLKKIPVKFQSHLPII